MAGPSAYIPTGVLFNNFKSNVPPTINDDSSKGYSVGSSIMINGTGESWRCRDDTLGAARWVKGDVADHPGYVAGRVYLPFGHGTPLTGIVAATNTMYFSYGVIKQRITISQLGARVTTVSSGGNFQLAVYNHNPLTAMPSTLVGATPSGSTGTATLVNIALPSNQALEPGPYWFGYSVDNTTAIFISNGLGSPAQISLVGGASSAVPGGTSNASQLGGIAVAGTFGTWPADLTGTTINDAPIGRVPIIQFLVASVP